MSKKDDIIASLENQLKRKATENDGRLEGYNKLLTEKDELEKTTQLEFQKQKETHSRVVKQLQAEIKEISEHKDTMFLSVNITGEDDIDALLNQAEKSMESRLAKKGLKDKYILLAKPDTIGIEIHR